MTASEFAFLALGLVLGAAAGAALVEVLRSRPPTRREVRVTVAPNSIPRRASTLTDADPVDRGPARGGPADRRWVDRDLPPDDPPGTAFVTTGIAPGLPPIDPTPARVAVVAPPPLRAPDRTPVPSGPSMTPFRISAGGTAGAAIAMSGARAPIGITISREPDPMVTALRATEAATAAAAMRRGPGRKAADGEAQPGAGDQSSVAVAAAATKAEPGGDGGTGGDATASPAEAGSDPGPSGAGAPDDTCGEQRRVADERCEVAVRAREGAAAAVEALRTGQRTYDDHINRGEAEAASADPRVVREAKEAAQRAFRQRQVGRPDARRRRGRGT